MASPQTCGFLAIAANIDLYISQSAGATFARLIQEKFSPFLDGSVVQWPFLFSEQCMHDSFQEKLASFAL